MCIRDRIKKVCSKADIYLWCICEHNMEEQKFLDTLFDEMFNLFDTDKDGVISSEDVKVYLLQTPHAGQDRTTLEHFQFLTGPTTTKAGAKLDVTLAYLAAYIRADTGKDKRIDVDEAMKYKGEHCEVKGVERPNEEAMKEWFEKLDGNKDGYLGLSEFFEFIDMPMV
eukprot:TRINITY_DN2658_c0_g2_i1.p1 TRINITY_DN2658_c0_g2~~TRINITY_DN2658_c0_g2_i1.p1  ORF type:complete len:168 (-),score=47.32 TRINITY_DN2658_c0_g2_i1:43-546(-)